MKSFKKIRKLAGKDKMEKRREKNITKSNKTNMKVFQKKRKEKTVKRK